MGHAVVPVAADREVTPFPDLVPNFRELDPLYFWECSFWHLVTQVSAQKTQETGANPGHLRTSVAFRDQIIIDYFSATTACFALASSGRAELEPSQLFTSSA